MAKTIQEIGQEQLNKQKQQIIDNTKTPAATPQQIAESLSNVPYVIQGSDGSRELVKGSPEMASYSVSKAPLYKDSTGNYVPLSAYVPEMSLNKKTGDIDIYVPKPIAEEDWFKKQFSENQELRKLSQAYKLNPDYAYETTDENGKTVYKKAEELINEYSEGLKKTFESLNQLYAERDKILRPVYGNKVDKMTTDDIRVALTPTYNVGDYKVNDSTVISLPDFLLNHSIFGEQIKKLESYNADNGTVTRGDFMENFWNRNKNPELTAERIQELYQNLGTTLNYSNWENVEEDDYERHGSNQAAREIAFRNFISGQDPEADFLLKAGDVVTGTIGGIGRGLVDTSVGIFNLLESVNNFLTPGDDLDSRVVKDVAEGWESWKNYDNEQLALISDASSTMTNVAELVTELVANIYIGNLAAGAVAGATDTVLGTLVNKAQLSSSSSLGKLILGYSAALESSQEAGKIVKSAIDTQKAFAAGGALAGSIVNITTQAIVDATLTNPVLFRQAIDGDGGEEAQNYLSEQYAWNVLGFGMGIGLSKLITAGADTKVGRAINAKWAQGNAKLKTVGYNISDGIKTKILHRSLEDAVAETAEQAAKKSDDVYKIRSERIQQQMQSIKDETRAFAKADIDIFDGLKISDEGLKEAEDYITRIKSLQNAVDAENRSLKLWVESYDDIKVNPEMASFNKAMYKSELKYIDAERSVVSKTGKTFTRMQGTAFSQEAANYIGASVELKYMEAVIASPGNFSESTVASAKKYIDGYREAITKYTKEYGAEWAKTLDDYMANDKKWFASMNQYRASKGLTNAQDLEDLLQSPLFKDGDYMRVQRVKDKRLVTVTLADGTKYTNMNLEFQHLGFDKFSDFMAPDTVQNMYKWNTARAERGTQVLKTRLSAKSAMKEVLVSGEDTQFIKDYKVARAEFDKVADEMTSKYVKESAHFDASVLADDYNLVIGKDAAVKQSAKKVRAAERAASREPAVRINDSDRLMAAQTLAPTDVSDMLKSSGKSKTGSILQDGLDEFGDDTAAFSKWYQSLPDESKSTINKIRRDYNEYVGGMPSVEYTEKYISFSDSQTAKGIDRKNLPVADTKKTPMKARRQLMKKELGTIDSEGLTKSWFADADVKTKKEIASKISNSKKLHDATLSEMYSLSGSTMPYKEWLDTPIEVRRVQTSDALRNDDAFMSFSMGDTLPAKEGNVVTLDVKPKDTYGSVYLGSTSTEKEVLVPRDVYKKAWDNKVSQLEANVADAEKKLAEFKPRTNAKETISNLSYAERKALAQKFVQENPDYTVLYRVQNGTPDQFRPNNRGKKGKFEGNVGEYKGYVWLTSDPEWAEGAERASAGVPSRGKNKISDENIVVLPVKKADITSYAVTGSESDAMRGLESGQKVVQSRGTPKGDMSIAQARLVDRADPRGFEKTEFIINGGRNPEIFDEGMDLLLGEYNKQFDPKNPAIRKALNTYQNDLDNAQLFLKDYKPEASPQLKRISKENLETLIGVDPNLEDTINFQVFKNDKALLKSQEIDDLVRENKIVNDNFVKNEILKSEKNQLEKLIGAQQTDEFMDGIIDFTDRSLDDYLTAMKGDAKTQKMIKTIAQRTGSSEDDIARYLSLKALKRNQKVVNKQISAAFGKADKKMSHIGREVNKAFDSMLDDAIDRSMLALQGNPLVDGELYDEVKELARKIEDVSKTARDEFSNVIATTDSQGRKVFMAIDPANAKLFKTNIDSLKTPTNFLDKANKMMSKVFRLGTTGINLSSTMRQWFRDSGNAFGMGGAFKTIQKCSSELVDDLGERIVAELSEYDYKQLAKRATETGQDIAELAVQRELRMGQIISGQTTEAELYIESLSKAKEMKNGIEKAYDKLEDIMNNKRESYLRNRVYANNMLNALNNGKTLEQARVVAEFAMNNATTNFSRKLVHLQRVADSTPYFSAAINGSKSFWRMATLDPVGVMTRIMGGFVIPQMYLTATSLADENNRKVYENMPEYTKSENLVFVHNGIAMTIPIPQELAFIVDPFRQFTESLYGANKNEFWELAANDLLGAMPIDLSGFSTVDMDDMISDPTIFDRVERGVSKVFSQVAPIPLKSAYMMMTGIDPYSGKKLRDKSWVVWNDDTGEYETMDYNQGSFAKLITSWLGSNANGAITEKVLSGIFGNTGMDVLDSLVATVQKVSGDESADPSEGLKSQLERIGSSLTGEDYSMLNSEWQRAIAELEDQRDAILNSKEMQDIQNKLGQDIDDKTREKLIAKRKDLLADWQKNVSNVTTRLVDQGGVLDRYKFAAVAQLLNMNSVNGWVPDNKYLQSLTTQNYYAGRNEAYKTMQELGIDGVGDYSIFGYIKYKNGEPQIVYNSPTAIVTAGNLVSNAAEVDKANIEAIIKKSDLYTQRQQMYNQVNAIYNKSKLTNADYNKIDAIKMEYNNKALSALVPYLQKVTPEAITNNEQVMDILENIIQVPSAYEKVGSKYVSSGGGKLNKQQGFVRSYIKAILNKDNM